MTYQEGKGRGFGRKRDKFKAKMLKRKIVAIPLSVKRESLANAKNGKNKLKKRKT